MDQTHLAAAGAITIGGVSTAVTGTVYMGRNWASTPSLNPDNAYLQICLSSLLVSFEFIYYFDVTGSLINGTGTKITASGVESITLSDFEMVPTAFATSPYTGKSYFPTSIQIASSVHGLAAVSTSVSNNNWFDFAVAGADEIWSAPSQFQGTLHGLPCKGTGYIFFQPY